MAKMKRTVHGEKLTVRERFRGVTPKVYFKPRDVFCPVCHAKPNRRCTWTEPHLRERFATQKRGVWVIGTYDDRRREVARLNRTGRDHHERVLRGEHLTALARASAEALFRLAVTDKPSQRSTIAGFQSLPLFATPDES